MIRSIENYSKIPRVKLFIVCYAENVFVQSYGAQREFNFLPKPFTLKQLVSKVMATVATW